MCSVYRGRELQEYSSSAIKRKYFNVHDKRSWSNYNIVEHNRYNTCTHGSDESGGKMFYYCLEALYNGTEVHWKSFKVLALQ